MIPRLTAVRQVTEKTRIIADADVLADQFRVMIGQQVPLLDVSSWAGFKRLKFSPEVRLGVDVRALAPTVGTDASLLFRHWLHGMPVHGPQSGVLGNRRHLILGVLIGCQGSVKRLCHQWACLCECHPGP